MWGVGDKTSIRPGQRLAYDYMIDEMSELHALAMPISMLTQCTTSTVLHITWLDWLRSFRL